MHEQESQNPWRFAFIASVCAVLAWTAYIIVPEGALAHPVKPKVVKCHTGYKRVPKVVKRHGKRVIIHHCVKLKAKAKPKVTPTPVTPTTPAATKSSGRIPHSHLDPSFVQNPLNPFDTTWSYSASATEEITDTQGRFVANQAAPLPEGTLSFFVNGSLECAENVGPGHEEAECEVTLKAMGPQRVTTSYSSGSLSSTITEIDNVEPVPATSNIEVTYEQWAEGKTTAKGIEVGTLNMHLAVSPPPAEPHSSGDPTCEPSEKPLCIPLPKFEMAIPHPLFDAQDNAIVPVYMQEGGSGPEVKIDAMDQTASSGEVLWYPVSEIESGVHYIRWVSDLANGYSGNGSFVVLGGRVQPTYTVKVPLAFSPHIPAIVN